ncbi:MAG: AAA family ATPase, partial [Proteobacteria bacterium]|nr:AAA family ATPase [Pseudomonadota bacterium]
MDGPAPLELAQLRWACAPEALGFEHSDAVSGPPLFPPEGRWRDAFALAVALKRPGYHVFAAAENGVPVEQAAQEVLTQAATKSPTPGDWCYVYNFANPRCPNAICLPPGRGQDFRAQLSQLVDDLQQALVRTFEGEAYQSRRQLIEETLKERQENSFRALEREAQGQGVALLRTPQGFSFAPLKEGNVLSPAALAALPEAERAALDQAVGGLKDRLQG